MNKIRQIALLNARELELAIPPNASWHTDYRDTSIIYVGGLDSRLSEGDVLTIFSQFGEPVWLKLARDRDTGKSKGFGWLRYEDQRSCDLAVDNLGGADVLGRKLGVDHARYKRREDEDLKEFNVPVVTSVKEGRGLGGNKKERGRRKSDTPLLLEEDQKQLLEDAQGDRKEKDDAPSENHNDYTGGEGSSGASRRRERRRKQRSYDVGRSRSPSSSSADLSRRIRSPACSNRRSFKGDHSRSRDENHRT